MKSEYFPDHHLKLLVLGRMTYSILHFHKVILKTLENEQLEYIRKEIIILFLSCSKILPHIKEAIGDWNLNLIWQHTCNCWSLRMLLSGSDVREYHHLIHTQTDPCQLKVLTVSCCNTLCILLFFKLWITITLETSWNAT